VVRAATPPPPLPLRTGVAGLASVVRVDDLEDSWSPREGGGMLATTSRATCGASELDFAVVSRSPTELKQLLGGAGQPDEAPAADGTPAHGRTTVPGVDPEFLEFLDGDPWEGCDDVAEWGFVDWCADIARLKSSKVDEGATGLLAVFLADGDTDGGSTRANTAAEMSDRPSMESMSTCSLKSIRSLKSIHSLLKGAASPSAERMMRDQEFESAFWEVIFHQEELLPSTRAPSSDCHLCPEIIHQEGSETNGVPKDDHEDWELSFLLRSVADMDA
jgi:hypothetical protein